MAVVWSFLYFIWNNRNKCVFANASSTMVEHSFEFQVKTFDWVTRRDKDHKIEMEAWLFDPFDS